MEPNHRRLIRAVSETAWAILPSKLAAILELVSLRAEGYKFSEEEVRERIGAARQPRNEPVGASGGVAVLPLYGVIAPKANLMSEISGGTSLERFVADFRELMGNDQVSTILLDIDSPGGSVDLVPEVAAEIRAARGRKQIVAVANTTAASAAYWLASQAGELVVTPSGEVGSIGVFAAHQDISGLQEKAGVKTTLISRGEFKTEGNPFEPLSEEARQAIQETVDEFYGMFVADVARGRSVEPQAVVDGFGQGRMVTARDAIRAGMADRVATFDETLARLTGKTPAKRRARADEGAAIDLAALAAYGTKTVSSGIAAGSASAFSGDAPIIFAKDTAGPEEPPVEAQIEPTSRATASSTSTRKEGTTMFASIEELVARQDEIRTRQQEIDAEHPGELLPDDLRAEFDALDEEYDSLQARVDDQKRRTASLARKAKSEKSIERGDSVAPMTAVGRKVPENIYALEEYRSRAGSIDEMSDLYADGAKRAIELATFPHPHANREDVQSHLERLIGSDKDAAIARRLLATGSQQYERAFGKMVMGKPLNSTELQALSMYGLTIGTPSDGGYAIPFTLDPTVIPTSNGAVNPWRQLARIITITGNEWKGVTSDGVTVAYEAEATEVAAGSPVLAQPDIHVEKAQVYVKYSIEVEQDWPQMRAELAVMIQDAKDAKEANKFALGAGHGSNEPQGVVAFVSGGNLIDTAASGTFAVADIDTLDNALAPRFEPNANVVANKSLYNKIRALTGDQFDVYMPLAQGILKRENGVTGRELAGYPAWRSSEMDSAFTAGKKVLLLGDFRYFAIVDRVGMSLEVLPLVVGASGRPTGERGLYGHFRNSSGVLEADAFKLLKIKA